MTARFLTHLVLQVQGTASSYQSSHGSTVPHRGTAMQRRPTSRALMESL